MAGNEEKCLLPLGTKSIKPRRKWEKQNNAVKADVRLLLKISISSEYNDVHDDDDDDEAVQNAIKKPEIHK